MKKGISFYIYSMLLLISHQFALADTGKFFTITNNGDPVAPYKVELCLNAEAPMTCQEYTVTSRTLSIRTVVANKLYPKAGIKIKSGSFVPNGNCTAIGNGYCNLQANNVADQIFTAGSPGDNNDLVEDETELAHSVRDLTTNAALTGTARTVTVTNTGTTAATGLTIVTPTFNIGTPPTIATTCGTTLPPAPGPGNTCTITVTPDLNGTSSLGENGQPCSTGQAAVPWEVAINSDNSDAIKFDFSVLTYGCIYQGGYIFSIDDGTPADAKIGGKVFSLENQVAARGGTTRGPGAAWGPDAPSVSGIAANSTCIAGTRSRRKCRSTSSGDSWWRSNIKCRRHYRQTSRGRCPRIRHRHRSGCTR
jgi:hypothetical protein